MARKIHELHPPRGFARLAFRLPIWLYRLGLGGLLGTRFLLLTHVGRTSGRERKTVLEVVRSDAQRSVFVVAAGFGPQSDWYQNIRARPRAEVQCGRRRWMMTADFLTPEQAGGELVEYGRRHPAALRELVRFMGFEAGESEEETRAVGRQIAMVLFHPETG